MDYCSYGSDRWKILFGDYSGPEARAIDLLYGAVSGEVPYCLVLEKAKKDVSLQDSSLLIIGTRASNGLLASLVPEEKLPSQGYLVEVGPSPFQPGKQVAILCGTGPAQVIYSVSHFLNEYLPIARQRIDHMPYFRTLFVGQMPEYSAVRTPAFEQRGIWTWGHCIYDYRNFAQNMAKLGLNAITIWNDHAPLNLRQVVDCFHSYGIRVNFGYSWGWGEQTLQIDSPEALAHWKHQAISTYEQEYAGAGGDGIYFQSFTETDQQEINGVSIADSVVHWVNTLGGAMLERWPNLQIQFGLHATSVRSRMATLKKIDPRIHIIWEDCGAFPYAYLSRQTADTAQTLAFTDKLASLRPGTGYGVVLKGQVCLDWDKFEHQKGTFLLGQETRATIQNRLAAIRCQWHDVQSYWLKNIGLCQETLQHLPGAKVYALVEDALLEECCWYPVALYAQLLWTPDLPVGELLQKVAQRSDVTFA